MAERSSQATERREEPERTFGSPASPVATGPGATPGPLASRRAVVAGRTPLLTEREFALFQRLIFEETGIALPESKQALLVGRLGGRVRDLGLSSFTDYYRLVVRDKETERVRMLDRMLTNETRFFREPKQFDFLERQVLPAWAESAEEGRRPRRVRVWSAACSTGEEPYSVAMSLLARFPPSSGWEIEVLATDLSTRVLARAREAVWSAVKASEIPPAYLSAFMLRGRRAEEGLMKAAPCLRSLVRVERVNLNAAAYPVSGPFDLILCRNVLIYFHPTTRRAVVRKLIGYLAPDGLLMLGHAESLTGLTEFTRSVGPTVFARAGAR
jgi:chemotaxis protein methyltransferase CheR